LGLLLLLNNSVIVGFGQLPLVNELLITKGVSDLVQGYWVDIVEELILVHLVVWLNPSIVLVSGGWLGLFNWLLWFGILSVAHFCKF
jgi:hypothetical protein